MFGLLASAHAEPLEQAEIIDLQLRWHHQFQFAGYYAAVEKGYYLEEGLAVRLHEGDPAHQPIPEVLSGRAQYAEGNSELLYQRLLGKPLVALAAIFQHSPSVLLVRQDSNIQSVHDLIDKRIMLMNMTEDADFLTMFLSEGIGLYKLNITPSSYNLNDLISGKVDAFNSYLTNEPYFLKQKNIAYRVIAPSNYRIDFYSDILFTTETELHDHPKRVAAMRRATLKGWHYAMDHQEEIIDLLINKYSVKKSREHLQFEAEEMRKIMFPDLIEIGHMNPGRWQHMADTFVKAGLVKPGYSLDGFIYDTTPNRLPAWVLPVTILVLGVLAIVSYATYSLHRLNRRLHQTQTELLKSKKKLDEAQHIARLGSWDWDIAADQVDWSETAADIYTPDDKSVTPSVEVFKKSIHPEDYDQVMLAIESTLTRNTSYDIEHRVVSKTRGERYVHAQGKVTRDHDGKALKLIGTVQDITERKKQESIIIEALAQANRFKNALDHISAFIYMKDQNHRYVYANQPTLDLFDCTPEELIGSDDRRFFPEDVVSKLYAVDTRVMAQGENSAEEIESRTADGEIRYYWEVKTPIFDPQDKSHIWGLCGISYDITERKFLEEELKRQAHIDYLTGVNNRRHFMEQAELELRRAVRYNNPLCIFMMDIDYFKQINDSYGHKTGDIVLKKLTEICQHTLREVDIIGRVGGEEFAILLPETNLDKAFEVAERLRVVISETNVPLENGLPVHFTVSIGVAALAAKEDNLDVLINVADKALYTAKNLGRNKVCTYRHAS